MVGGCAVLLYGLYIFRDLFLAAALGFKVALHPSQQCREQPGQQEIDHRGGDQGEECLVGVASDNVAHFGQVIDRNVAHDRRGLDQFHRLAQ